MANTVQLIENMEKDAIMVIRYFEKHYPPLHDAWTEIIETQKEIGIMITIELNSNIYWDDEETNKLQKLLWADSRYAYYLNFHSSEDNILNLSIGFELSEP